MTKPSKRRRLLIDYRFQTGHIARLLLLTAINGTAMFMILALLVLTGLDHRLTVWQMPTAMFLFAGVLGVALVAAIVWSLYYTHSIVGPMVRVCRMLDAISAGKEIELTPFRFRKRDQLTQVGRSLDGCLSELRRIIADRAKLREGVEAAWRALNESNEAEEALQILGELRSSHACAPSPARQLPDKTPA